MARYVAKNIVAPGLADRCEVQLAYAIGVAEPVSVLVDTFGTGTVEPEQLEELVRANFIADAEGHHREPASCAGRSSRQTAAYGHFGRTGDDFTWEKTDKAAALKAGVAEAVATL